MPASSELLTQNTSETIHLNGSYMNIQFRDPNFETSPNWLLHKNQTNLIFFS